MCIYKVFVKKHSGFGSYGWKCSGSGRGDQLEVGVNSVLVRSQNEEMEEVKKNSA